MDVVQLPVLADLPVGNNLQNHGCVEAGAFTINSSLSITAAKVLSATSRLKYKLYGGGKCLLDIKIALVYPQIALSLDW